ncbi:MAG: putative lipid II flippase FtsW [Eubacterium sp.]|nr:putative lipid II flippase FtsW [Eubacterium sp.]
MPKNPARVQPRYFDWGLVFIVIFLAGFGLVMLYSVSSYNAQVKFGSGLFYVKKQGLSVALGIIMMIIVSLIDYHIWYKLSTLIYLAAFGLNSLLLFSGLAANYGGSTRWLSIAGFSFQPSEAAKVAVIIFTAALISRIPNREFMRFRTVVIVLGATAPLFILVALSNLSTAIIILTIATVMVFVASPRYMQFVAIALMVVCAGAVFLVTFSYRLTRIKVWLNPEGYDTGYQTLQGLYAIGSGGIFGKGLGESLQKLGNVPEPENDMIFSIICEELGLVGAIAVILLFLLLIWRFLVIAFNADDIFGSFLSIGVMTHIAVQAVLNIAVVTNSIPNTGVTLPFISYGGTSTIILMTEIGIVLSVSHGIKLRSLVTKQEKQEHFKNYVNTLKETPNA